MIHCDLAEIQRRFSDNTNGKGSRLGDGNYGGMTSRMTLSLSVYNWSTGRGDHQPAAAAAASGMSLN